MCWAFGKSNEIPWSFTFLSIFAISMNRKKLLFSLNPGARNRSVDSFPQVWVRNRFFKCSTLEYKHKNCNCNETRPACFCRSSEGERLKSATNRVCLKFWTGDVEQGFRSSPWARIREMIIKYRGVRRLARRYLSLIEKEIDDSVYWPRKSFTTYVGCEQYSFIYYNEKDVRLHVLLYQKSNLVLYSKRFFR